MIEKLTDEQKEHFKVIVDKWVQIGLSTEVVSQKQADKVGKIVCELLDHPQVPTILMNGPISTWIATCKIQEATEAKELGEGKELAKQLNIIADEVRQDIKDGKKVPKKYKDIVFPYLSGQWDANYFAWGEAMLYIGVTDFTPLWDKYRETSTVGWIYPLEKAIIICNHPKHVRTNKTGQLHADEKPAIEYSDGWKMFALNGVSVPQWLAETPTEKIEPSRIGELTNAGHLREFVRKVGLERILYKLHGKVIDEKVVKLNTPLQKDWPCTYRLIELNYGESAKRRVLQMDNPSLPEIQHVEYVPTATETIDEAMNFRLARQEEDVDEKNGDSWYLHGDVIIRPKNLKKWKRWPDMIA